MEKKLTDEEIVKALDVCYNSPCCNADCPYFNKNGRNLCLENKAFYRDMKRIAEKYVKQKAEIERLTEERDMYADDLYWKAEVRKREDFITELTVENAELQKQVDELRKPINGKFKDNNALNKAYESLEKEFTKRSQRLRELQNKENKEQVIECYGILKGCDMVKQAVKDAAKEIFTDLLKEFSIRKSCGNADVVVREMATRKGVEVE